ncbi:MAG: extracellular solute-binding protein, partial [Candidatus Dojkabacteria bacterium]|nr:extracellular solute-binding protein [Candidatus Dojkabacteria bacterium]
RLITRLQQSSSSNEPAPDIFRIHNTWIPKFYQYLYALPSSIMSAQQYSDAFYPTAVDDLTAKDGNIYAIPLEIDGLMIFYNKQLLAEEGASKPPTDWDSLIELAQDLTKKDSAGRITQAGLAIGTSRNILHSAEIFSFLLLQEGVSIIDETRTSVTLNTSKIASILNTYTNFASGETAIWSSDLKNDLEMFFEGKLAMMIAPSWRTFDIITASPSTEFDTAPLPQLAANQDPVYFSTYWAEAVSKSSEYPEEAWKFIKFLAQKESQMTMYSNASKIRAFGEPYSLKELNSEMAGKKYVSAIAEMAPYMQSWQMGDETFVKTAINEAITAVVESGDSASTALKKAEDDINDQLAQTNQ